jgi:hypothetical protein
MFCIRTGSIVIGLNLALFDFQISTSALSLFTKTHPVWNSFAPTDLFPIRRKNTKYPTRQSQLQLIAHWGLYSFVIESGVCFRKHLLSKQKYPHTHTQSSQYFERADIKTAPRLYGWTFWQPFIEKKNEQKKTRTTHNNHASIDFAVNFLILCVCLRINHDVLQSDAVWLLEWQILYGINTFSQSVPLSLPEIRSQVRKIEGRKE